MNELEQVKDYLQSLQSRIVAELEQLDGKAEFRSDTWQRPGGGGGLSCVLGDGAVFEKAGVGFSHVFGDKLPPSATKGRPDLADSGFQAVGVSLVIHPLNPYVPTTHANFRFFTAGDDSNAVWWFGGGFDLTPYYPFEEDVIHWHQAAKAACDPFGDDLYARYKAWCDEYFFLKHRNHGFDRSFEFLRSAGDSFLPAYSPIVGNRKDHPYGDRQRQFQLYRRGRYVEFNLIYDRGTIFGLQSGGRTESILMSLPPLVRWDYDWQPEAGSPEDTLYRDFLQPRDWLATK